MIRMLTISSFIILLFSSCNNNKSGKEKETREKEEAERNIMDRESYQSGQQNHQ